MINIDEMIIYEYNFFISVKDQIVINNDLKNKINTIFTPDYQDTYTKNVVTFYSNYVIKPAKINTKEKKLNRKNKDVKVELFTLFNKITEINYTSILPKIRVTLMKDKDVLIKSLEDLWRFCYKQPIYSVLYIEIFKSLFNTMDAQSKKLFIEKLKVIVKDFIDNEIASIENVDKLEDNTYDEFCDNNIKQKNIRGKLITISWFIVNTQFDIITKEQLLLAIEDHSFNKESVLELIHIYNTIIGLDTRFLDKLKLYKDITIDISKKNKYKIMDIIDKKPFMMDGFKIIFKI